MKYKIRNGAFSFNVLQQIIQANIKDFASKKIHFHEYMLNIY